MSASRTAVTRVFNHRLRPEAHLAPTRLNEQFLTDGYQDGSMARLADYRQTAEFVRQMPTAAEKIAFVNPYERPWARMETKWHRVQHALLHKTRKAHALPPIPRYFDCLDFYQWITRMVEVEHRRAPFRLPVRAFESRLTESLLCSLDGATQLSKTAADGFLRRALDDAFASLAHTNDLVDLRVSHSPRCESFWICAGFSHLYRGYDHVTGLPVDDIRRQARIIGDHRQKLGELAFTMRDELVAQVRQRAPLKDTFDFPRLSIDDFQWMEEWRALQKAKETPKQAEKAPPEESDEQKQAEEQHARRRVQNTGAFERLQNEKLFSPLVYNIWPDEEPLWQCPGYEPESDETHPFGRLAIKNTHSLNEQIAYWGMQDEEAAATRFNCLRSTAVSSLFNWLNGQAHCAGYTQYGWLDDGRPTDFAAPFHSQLILSDGREFFFASAQLNTIAFNIMCKGFENDRANGIQFEGPFNLYDEFDPSTATFKHKPAGAETLVDGLNPQVMERLLGYLHTH
ncbi:28S ribosomal protein S30, mitochondrial [Aphelenchoides fujianensis]|nr:28S ribosomal protein S30, mitochondrial [Aphelenchoides fujianensis]